MAVFATLIVLAAICYFAYRTMLYPSYFGPLSGIQKIHPLCAISTRWSRNLNRKLEELRQHHVRHGAIIRTGPNEISIADPQAIRVVYGHNWDKDRWYTSGFTSFGGRRNLVSMLDRANHFGRRRILAGPYANTTVVRSPRVAELLTYVVRNRIHPLCEKLARQKQDINIFEMAQWYTADCMSAYLFGLHGGTNFVEDERSREIYFGDFRRVRLTGNYAAKPYMESMCMDMCKQALRTSIAGEGVGDEQTVFNHMTRRLQISDNSLDQVTTCASEMLDHMIAAHESAGITLTYIIYRLSLDSGMQARIRNEVHSTGLYDHILSDSSSRSAALPSVSEVDKLPLLEAVLNETLRLHSPSPGQKPRGTVVSTNAYTLHRNEELFSDPLEWKPDRWLSTDEQARRGIAEGFWAFGNGSRGCIGRSFGTAGGRCHSLSSRHQLIMTLIVLKMVVVYIYSRFETSITDEDGAQQADSYIAYPRGWKIPCRFDIVS
ncbi:hypothetical protein LTR86_010415 [Recurvomyces mirabilis]|nr:hypothetical protein LTR86_010415 [Recurvomyces mirabilis]